jgi:hypothetical protein
MMIQIIVVLEILISCFLRLGLVWFMQWTNQLCRTPKWYPLGRRTEGNPVRLATGMPNAPPTGLKDGLKQRAKRYADNNGLDEEMLWATE